MISATGVGKAISASSSVANTPLIIVPSLLKSPKAWFMTLTSIFLGLYFRALLCINFAPESASPISVLTLISGRRTDELTILGSPDIIPSASVTSTTSKKPGDVNEESSDGIIYKVYEITVKPFDLARIRDSYDCIIKYNEANNSDLNEIIVICRKEDCIIDMKKSGLYSYLGSYAYQNIMYYYWDIYEWVSDALQHMTQEGRIAFYNDLNTYIEDINTAEKVKKLWYKLHQ